MTDEEAIAYCAEHGIPWDEWVVVRRAVNRLLSQMVEEGELVADGIDGDGHQLYRLP